MVHTLGSGDATRIQLDAAGIRIDIVVGAGLKGGCRQMKVGRMRTTSVISDSDAT